MTEVTLAEGTLDSLRKLSTATVTMQLLKRGIRNCFITGAPPLDPQNCNFVAEAYTLRFVPMREDMATPAVLGNPNYAARRAIEDIAPGQAMVIDARGDMRAGVIGDILVARLKVRGIAAVVSDGPVRDAAEVAKTGVPVFCPGGSAPASLHVHFGADIQCPIGCGGTAVFPGDVLVGDGDGVAVVPRALADEVARDGLEQERLEGFIKSRIEAGHTTFGTYPPNEETMAAYRAWVDSQDR